MEMILGIIIGKLLFGGDNRPIWEWAVLDGYDIKKSDWIPNGYSPSDLVSKKKWLKLNKHD